MKTKTLSQVAFIAIALLCASVGHAEVSLLMASGGMILDLQTMFSGSVSAAGVKSGDAITATAISANVLDLRQPQGTLALADEGLSGPEEWLVIQTDNSAAFAAAGAATLVVTLESDSTANLATAPVVHFSTAVIAKATLVANFVIARLQIPSDLYKRFLGIRYTVATGPFTAGAVLAFMTPDLNRNITYPIGYSIDS